MPGLLETPPTHFGQTKYFVALFAEFLGSMMFALMGGAALYVAVHVLGPPPNVVMASLANGLALMLAIYAVANISGGHITPSVTIATMITGHIPLVKGVLYMVSQFLGAIFASLCMAGLVPGASIGMGDLGPGCFAPGADVDNGQLFGWEFFNSFILVSVVYAVAIGSPSFGNVAPLAAGLTLTAVIFGSAAFSGGGVSPARVLGPVAVFHCYYNKLGYYFLGQFGGGIVAGIFACPLYGGHAMWIDRFIPWGHTHYESKLEADGSFRGMPGDGKMVATEAPMMEKSDMAV